MGTSSNRFKKGFVMRGNTFSYTNILYKLVNISDR